MRDYNYLRENGEHVPVAQMTDAEIAEVLTNGFTISDDDGMAAAAEAIRDRLLVEQVARAIGER